MIRAKEQKAFAGGGCQHHNVGAISSDGLLWHKLLIGLYNSEWLISSLDDGDERFVPGEKRGQVGRNGVYNYMGCLTVLFCSQSGLLPIPGWCHFSFRFTLSSIEEWISSGKWDTHTHECTLFMFCFLTFLTSSGIYFADNFAFMCPGWDIRRWDSCIHPVQWRWVQFHSIGKKLHLKNSTVMCLSRNTVLVSSSQPLLWTVFHCGYCTFYQKNTVVPIEAVDTAGWKWSYECVYSLLHVRSHLTATTTHSTIQINQVI